MVVLGLVPAALAPASAQSGGVAGLTLAGVNATSTGQAGYFVTKAPASASASVKFTVPRLTCTSTNAGVAFGSTIFTGTGTTSSYTAANLFVLCRGGAPLFAAVVAVNAHATQGSFTPAAGDVITASVTESTTAAKAVLTDVTKSKILSARAVTGRTNALVLDGVDTLLSNTTGKPLPIPNFGTENFRAGQEDGTTVHAAGAIAVDLKTATGVLKIHTGTLNAAGDVWNELFKHS
jgi:hypothetical protein